MAARVAPSKQAEVDSTNRQKRRHLAKYQEKAGKYTKMLNICAWDRDASGQLKVFESEKEVLEHEAGSGERRKQGEYPAGGYKQLTTEQQALVQSIHENNQIEHDETRGVVKDVAEDLRGRLDRLMSLLVDGTHKQTKLDEKKLEVAKAKAEQNEAFAQRVEAGECTTLERIQFDIAILQAKARMMKQDIEIGKKRAKAERATATSKTTGATSTAEPVAKRCCRRTAAAGIAASPSVPQELDLSRVLCIRCPQVALAMLDGTKVVENRNYKLPLGWHWLYISKCKDLKGFEDFKAQINKLQYSMEKQDKAYCKLIGAIFISEIRAPEECNMYPWAKGPHCHIISRTCTLIEPVPIEKPARVVRWSIKNEAERQMIKAQLLECAPKVMDLTPLMARRAVIIRFHINCHLCLGACIFHYSRPDLALVNAVQVA